MKNRIIPMKSIAMKVWTYTILFITIGACGSFMANIMESTGCPQYIRNVIYCSVITIFALENWTLLSDITKYEERGNQMNSSETTIKNLTLRCNALQKQNDFLRNELETIKGTPQKESVNGENISQAMNAWVFYCNSENSQPPSKFFLINPLESKNSEKLSPLSVRFQTSTPKIPPIKKADSL